MRTLRKFAAAGAFFTCAIAHADPNDFRIFQLGQPAPASCVSTEGGCNVPNPDPSKPPTFIQRGNPDANTAFRIFARQFGAALSSVNLMPAETLGHAAFAVTAELSVVDLKSPGFPIPTEGALAGKQLQGSLLIPSVHIRKGLPFSFEVGSRFAWIEKSRMGAATVEVKWALNEGFTYLPDLSVRGFGVRLLNSRDFDLTTAGLDFSIGKQLAIGGMITLTPYAGWNLISVAASSDNIDFRPERSQDEVGKSREAQLQDANVYDELRIFAHTHNRFYGGLRFIGGVVNLGIEVSHSNFAKFRDAANVEWSIPAVLAVNFTAGLDF